MEEQKIDSSGKENNQAEIARISEACREKITQCEKELNKQGFYNIALVAYQMKD